jgi:PKHD-type hydroxylase
MFLRIANFLSAPALAEVQRVVRGADLDDGRKTGSPKLKFNRQSGGLDPAVVAAQRIIHEAISSNVEFSVFALPKSYRIFFNRYDAGMYYKAHIDMAYMGLGTNDLLRTDLSFTVLLSAPEDYEGGHFRIETPFGEARLKEAAGTLLCYPSDMLHEVEPVTSGSRLAAIGWVESLIPDRVHREIFRSFDHLGRDALKALPDPEAWRPRFAHLREGLLRAFALK